jgi:hypothetical protein
MGFEIPLDVDYSEHPKTLHLITLLKDATADAYPTRLWCWCAKFAKDGILKGDPVSTAEKAVRWKGKAGKCHAAMVEAGFLDKDGKRVHDWKKHAGRKIKQYEIKKENQRQKYAKEIGDDDDDSPPNSSGRSAEEFRQTATTQGGILPPMQGGILPTLNETKRNETKIDQTKRDESLPTDAAERVAFIYRSSLRGRRPEELTVCAEAFTEMMAMGIGENELIADLKRIPPERDRNEHLWQIKKRLLEIPKKGKNRGRPDAGDYDPAKSYPSADDDGRP